MTFAASSVWLYEIAYLPAAVAVIVAAGAIVERGLPYPKRQRTLWQAVTLTVLAFTLIYVSGAGHELGDLARRTLQSPKTATQPMLSPANPSLVAAPSLDPAPSVSVSPKTMSASRPAHRIEPSLPAPLLWFVCGWILGSAAFLFRSALRRLVFLWFRLRGRPVQCAGLLSKVRELSQRLGLRGRVRVIELPGLQAPIAFGFVRPTIGVPVDFASSPAEQEVMLAHELMHIAARDAYWYALAELAVALLWWHPAVWHLRRRLRNASEMAADEGSLLVEGGPAVLAGCLVRLGEQMRRPRPFAPMSVSGFRSGLGRRVEALLKLTSQAGAHRRSIARLLFPPALAALLVFCSAFTFNHRSMKGATMNGPHWKKSLPTMALLALLSTNVDAVGAEPSSKPTPRGPKAESLAIEAKRWSGTTRIREKLGRITLEQVRFDALPLSEVIRQLIEEARHRDPDKQGINFLLVNSAPLPTIDAATGLPIPSEPVDIGSTTIRIEPPLNNVRLIDVLDAIMKVADRPLRYTIQDYGVVLSMDPTPGSTEQLLTETFQVQHDIFFKGIESAFGIDVPGDVSRQPDSPRSALLQLSMLKVKQAEEELQDVKRLKEQGLSSTSELRKAEHAVETARAQLAAKEEEIQSRGQMILPNRETQQQVFRELFSQLGVRLEPPRSAFFNELTGILMVRVTNAEMEAIRPAIRTLGGTPTSELAVNKTDQVRQ